MGGRWQDFGANSLSAASRQMALAAEKAALAVKLLFGAIPA